MVTKAKIKGGLGILNLRLQNKVLLWKTCISSTTKWSYLGSVVVVEIL
jgi:hypothetical protein